MRMLLLLMTLAAHAYADPQRPATLGTAHPVRVLAADPNARWAVLCEARADTDHDGAIAVGPGFNGRYGDQMEAFLVLGNGPGTPIDDLVDADPNGRYLVVVRQGALVLLDTYGREVNLSARGAYSSSSRDTATGAYLGVSFDATGTHVSYVVHANHKTSVTVRALATGAEVSIDVGSGKLWSATLDGPRLRLEMLAPHANASIAFPSNLAPGMTRYPRCMTRTVSDDLRATGNRPIVRIAPATGGHAVDDPELLATLGDATLRRSPTGALILDDSRGKHELVPAACHGRIDGLDAVHRRVLVHCTAGGDTAQEVVSVGSSKLVGGSRTSTDDYFGAFGRHVLFSGSDADDTIYDVETGKIRAVAFNQLGLASLGEHTLVGRHGRLIMLDGGGETDLGAISRDYPEVFAAGSMRYVAPLVVDLAKGTLVGRAPVREVPLNPGTKLLTSITATVMAVSTTGQLLGTFSTKPTGYPDGPLEWLAPAPP